MDVGVHIDGQQVRCTHLALKDYILAAFQIKVYQVSGPDSMTERFDISAKLPAGAKEDQVADMLKSLLVERFGMKFHMEKKDFPVYALLVGKNGIKAKQSALQPESGADGDAPRPAVNVSGNGGRGGTYRDPFGKIWGINNN